MGCADYIVNAGLKRTGGIIWDGYALYKHFDFSILAGYTKYPFMLLTPQHITERILGQCVKEQKINVYRPFRVVDMQVNRENPDRTDVIFEDGQVVEADYVVGADGARSMVRRVIHLHTMAASYRIIRFVSSLELHISTPPTMNKETRSSRGL